jgi:RNA ligase (TIGR02306 family)
MGKGFRIKTITLRGALSQGLALPFHTADGESRFPELSDIPLREGKDVTELLSVRKWELPEAANNLGKAIGDKPYGIPTTDETRLQSMPEYIDALKGKSYYISTKMDGTSCTVYVKDGVVGVCGRNDEYKEDPESSSMWEFVYKHGIKEKLIANNTDLVLQGEFCGSGIQKNRLHLKEPELFIFDAGSLLSGGGVKKYGLTEMINICEKLGLKTVPIEEVGDNFDYTLESLLERARGKYSSGMDKEGIVVRTQEMSTGKFNVVKEDGTEGTAVRRLSFKVINNDFLMKDKD